MGLHQLPTPLVRGILFAASWVLYHVVRRLKDSSSPHDSALLSCLICQVSASLMHGISIHSQ